LRCYAQLFLASCTTIDSGSVGIKFKKWAANATEQGGVQGTCKGFVWYNPFTERIFEYPLYVQRKSYSDIEVNTKDASIFKMSPVIAYRLNEDKATYVFVKYRQILAEIEDGYIRTCIYEAYRTCGNTFSSDYLMSNRAEFEREVRNRLDKSLKDEGFIVEEFTAQITPPQSLRSAIDAKNEAVQNALKAENKVKEAEANAKIAIASAQGEASALKIKGDGEAYL
jgi:regulator of protease activity HflC (stomatin/prohibitin superfamily)